MALHYTNNHGSYFVKAGTALGQPLNLLSFSTSRPYCEPLIRSIFSTTYEYGWFPPEALIGYFLDRGEPETLDLLSTPVDEFEYDAPTDRQKYGSLLTDISAAGRVLRGESLFFSPGQEHQAWHASYQGDIGPFLQDDLLPIPPPFVTSVNLGEGLTLDMRAYRQPSENGHAFAVIQATNAFGGASFLTRVSLADVPSWGYRRDLVSSLEDLKSHISNNGLHRDGAFPWCSWYYDIFDFDFVSTKDKTVVTFSTEWGECGQYFWAWDVKLSITQNTFHNLPPATESIPWDGNGFWQGSIQTKLAGSVSAVIEATMVGRHPVDPPGFGSTNIGDKVIIDLNPDVGALLLSRCVQGDGTGGVPLLDALVSRRFITPWADRVWESLPDIRLSSYLSAADALDQISGGLDTNLVEAIGEIDEIGLLLPSLADSIKSILRLLPGRGVNSIRDAISVVASIRLQQKFAVDPTLDLLLNVLPRMEKTAKRIQQLADSGVVVGRGSFSFDFPQGEFGREESSLVTRSRVVASRDSKSVLEKALGARALGLLPSPSAVWDLVPFSFVLDWFTGAGERIRDLESLGFLSLMNIKVYTHSYSVRSFLLSDELDVYQVLPSNLEGSELPHLKTYLREVSSCVPRIGQGRYDFRLPDHLPNWLTAGSLLWQLTMARGAR